MIYEIEEKVHTDSILDVLVKTKKFIELTSSKSPLAFKMSTIRKYSDTILQTNLKYLFDDDDIFLNMVAEDLTINLNNKHHSSC